MARKIHLRDTKFGNPACAGKRAAYRAEHIAAPFAELTAAPTENRCERCQAGKLFAFLSRKS